MIIGIICISVAILLSIVSAVFSISGIITIFSAAAIGVAVMGGVLEIAKVSATVWVYQFWKKAGRLIKTYFMLAIVILIFISSVGIFSFLSKAYVGQSSEIVEVETEIQHYRDKIDREKEKIEEAQGQLSILDKAIDEYIELNYISRGLDKREEQKAERKRLNSSIAEARENIETYRDKVYNLKQKQSKKEVNVGPVKYLSILLYGEDNKSGYDKAARFLIILIVIVFDPFAVLLMVAGNVALDRKPKSKVGRPKKKDQEKKKKKKNKVDLWNNLPIKLGIKKEKRGPGRPKGSKTKKKTTSKEPVKEKKSKKDLKQNPTENLKETSKEKTAKEEPKPKSRKPVEQKQVKENDGSVIKDNEPPVVHRKRRKKK